MIMKEHWSLFFWLSNDYIQYILRKTVLNTVKPHLCEENNFLHLFI